MDRVVVGFDGSEGSEQALQEAIAEARLRGAELRVVSAWRMPVDVYGGAGGFAPPMDASTFDLLRDSVTQSVDDAVARARAAGVQCDGAVVEGSPASVLLDEAAGATLVVVGNRGHGGVGSLFLGSVSHQVVNHAPCPVLVVRERTT
jgi:nucleotide-binding universal stress UspA family protein